VYVFAWFVGFAVAGGLYWVGMKATKHRSLSA
jgi:cytosine/uracil/thiamine/allantoin permease